VNQVIKTLLIFLITGIVVIGGYFSYKALSKGEPHAEETDYEWVTIDEHFTPGNHVEEFIKNDSSQKGLFPVSMKNYGKNTSILGKFAGKNFAGPNEAQLNMMYNGLEDWLDLNPQGKSFCQGRRQLCL